jgi:methionyl-tRNA synthetase
MLMAWNDCSNEKYTLPQNVPANEFLNFEGKKFSKSRGWGIDVNEFLELFPADLLRYTLAANLPENKDTDFYWKEFQARTNNELADIFGNFINRTFTFAHKHFDGKVPVKGNLDEIDVEMIKLLKEYPAKVGDLLEKFKIKDAVFEMMNLARAGNKYFNDSEPWVLVKSNKEKCATTVNICLQAIYTLAEVFSPVIPFTSERIFKFLNAGKTDWYSCGSENLKDGHKLNQQEILFTKLEDKEIDEQVAKFCKPDEVTQPEAVAEITKDEFSNVHLRVAKILQAERVKKSDKLVKLQIDLGTEKKQILAGIAQSYEPEELIGKRIIVVANLKPAKLFGLESQGMLLAAEDENGKSQLLEVKDNVLLGTRIK